MSTLEDLQDQLQSQSDQIQSQAVEIEELRKSASHKDAEIAKQLVEDEREGTLAQVRALLSKSIGESGESSHMGQVSPVDSVSEDDCDPLEESLQKKFQGEDSGDASDPTTDDISSAVCGVLNTWFRKIHSGTEIQETLKLCRRPFNASALKNIEINPEVKKNLSHQDEHKDQRLKWLSNAILKSAQPLSMCYSKLLRLEFFIKQANENHEEDALIPFDLDGNETCREFFRICVWV